MAHLSIPDENIIAEQLLTLEDNQIKLKRILPLGYEVCGFSLAEMRIEVVEKETGQRTKLPIDRIFNRQFVSGSEWIVQKRVGHFYKIEFLYFQSEGTNRNYAVAVFKKNAYIKT